MPTRAALLNVFVGIASLTACSLGQTITWSGYTWNVRNDTGGPGPNTFLAANVFLDADGAST